MTTELFLSRYTFIIVVDFDEFVKLISNYENITELDFELVHTLIEKIVVHEKKIIDDKSVMRIDIYYRFIGNIDSGETI